jgi:D-glycero-D-manno-heptose 1,7-bisphosphate phosphatase
MGDDTQPLLVILDRDGVINRDSDEFIKSPDEFVPLAGSIEAIADLCRAGFRVVVASNQSGVGRGLLSVDTLERIHAKLRKAVAAAGGELAGIYYCPHAPNERCACRKPRPGLLLRIAAEFDVDLRGVPAVGDSARDLEAAAAVGAWPILVRTGNGRATERKLPGKLDVAVCDDLRAAADTIIAANRERTS